MRNVIQPSTGILLAALSLLASSAARGQSFQAEPRRPRGIYAVVDIENEITKLAAATPPVTAPAEVAAYFDTLYQQLLADPAISGLALQVHWDTVNPNPPGAANTYDWTYVDLAFMRASGVGFGNQLPTPKTIQLILSAGFQSPTWLLGQLDSCDPLFNGKTPPPGCGKVTFQGYREGGDHPELPLPWNAVYKNAWRNFLIALNGRYGFNPALVSVSVSGPTAASAEITLPSDTTASNPQTQFNTNISPNDMWNALFAIATPPLPENSTQVFIDEWTNAIDMFAEIFKGTTLTIATGDGLPNFLPGQTFTIPSPFGPACARPDMICWSVSSILSHFIEPSVGGNNAKATQTSGMEASRANPTQPPGDMGVAGARELALATAHLASPSAQILGGAQFNTRFSTDPVGEGCLIDCSTPPNDKISPEQAEYNVLYVYLYGTPVASFFGGVPGPAPMNYLQIYSEDIQYSETNAHSPVTIMQISGVPLVTTAQDLLNLASKKLLEIAEPPVPAVPPHY